MDLTELIKESFVFPSNNLKQLAIYIVFSFVATLFTVGGIFSIIGIAYSGLIGIVSIILFIIALLVGFILSGYQISLIGSGISQDELAPEFDYKENIVVGIKSVILKIIYLIIPALITIIVAVLTGVLRNAGEVARAAQNAATNATTTAMASNVTYATSIPASTSSALFGSLTITAIVGIILFIIFGIFLLIAEARLANTDSLGEALRIGEVFNDVGRIGYGNVIATIVLVCLITVIINAIIRGLGMVIPFVGILSIIVTPYLIFFAYRAIGLLYSDIA